MAFAANSARRSSKPPKKSCDDEGIEGMVTSFPGMVTSYSVNNVLYNNTYFLEALEAIPRSQTNKLQLEIRPFQKGNFIFRPESLRDYVGFRKGTRGSPGDVFLHSSGISDVFLVFRIGRMNLINPGIQKFKMKNEYHIN